MRDDTERKKSTRPVEPSGSKIIAWVHNETEGHYAAHGQSHMSTSLAISSDYGLTSKDYGLILTGTDHPPGQQDQWGRLRRCHRAGCLLLCLPRALSEWQNNRGPRAGFRSRSGQMDEVLSGQMGLAGTWRRRDRASPEEWATGARCGPLPAKL